MLNLMRDKHVKACTGGEKGRHKRFRLVVQKVAEGIFFNHLLLAEAKCDV